MFTFHKPKVFRSVNGCCICKAKSSSSRFTDSVRYEACFKRCFLLEKHRTGEICNACVLLVKRFIKLPRSSKKDWSHVVDARSGPGIKSLVKSKNKKAALAKEEEEQESPEKGSFLRKKHVYIKRKRKTSRKQKKSLIRRRLDNDQVDAETEADKDKISGFLDKKLWKRKKICCGHVFIGPYGEVAVDTKFLKPCANRCQEGAKDSGDNNNSEGEESSAAASHMEVGEEEEEEEDEYQLAARKLAESCAASTSGESTVSSASVEGAEVAEAMEAASSSAAAADGGLDTDEGFFDKPAVSPDSLATSPTLMEEEELSEGDNGSGSDT